MNKISKYTRSLDFDGKTTTLLYFCKHIVKSHKVFVDPAIQHPGHARSSTLHRAKINPNNEGTDPKNNNNEGMDHKINSKKRKNRKHNENEGIHPKTK